MEQHVKLFETFISSEEVKVLSPSQLQVKEVANTVYQNLLKDFPDIKMTEVNRPVAYYQFHMKLNVEDPAFLTRQKKPMLIERSVAFESLDDPKDPNFEPSHILSACVQNAGGSRGFINDSGRLDINNKYTPQDIKKYTKLIKDFFETGKSIN